MNSDKYECLYNMIIITDILEDVEEHMIEKPHKTKATLHQLNQQIQEYLKNYGVDAEAVMTKAKKDDGQDEE